MSQSIITKVHGRRLWDSRGRPTVEVDVQLDSGALGRAIAPAGASTGSGEAVDLRDGGETFGGRDVRHALAAVNGEIADALQSLSIADQAMLDKVLIELDGTPNKSRLGGNALIAVSMACLKAAAADAGKPLWQYLAGERKACLPLPEIQIFGGGAHAAGRIDVQDFMVTAIGAPDFVTALDWTAEIYRAAGKILSDTGRLQGVADEGGFWPAFDSNEQALEILMRSIETAGLMPGQDVAIALDIAATEFERDGLYHLRSDDKVYDRDSLCEKWLDWLERYPIVMIEDPLAENDVDGFIQFTQAAGENVQIIGDDFLVTNAKRIQQFAAQGGCNAALIKPNQAGTITETLAALEAARTAGWGAILSARSGESEDVTITHLAVGWGAKQLKVGSITRSERNAKWNEGIRIAEQLGEPQGILAKVFVD